MSQHLLDRCVAEATYRGIDVNAEYEPYLPVDLMQTLMLNVHDYAGCSWGMAIVLGCISIRIVTLPVSVAAIRGSREKAMIQPVFNKLMEEQKQAAADGDQERTQKVAKEIQAFTNKHGRFFMLKGAWNLLCIQMPLYITAFAAMRGIASHPDTYKGFAMESPLWLDSLALADPYALLPIFTGAIMLTNTELFGSIDTETAAVTPGNQSAAFEKYKPYIMRGSAVLFVPMTWNFPAGIFIFMSTNMIVATFQNRLLKVPALERMLEIPPPLERVESNAAAGVIVVPSQLLPMMPSLQQRLPQSLSPARIKPLEAASAPAGKPEGASSRSVQVTKHTAEPTSFRSLADLENSPRFAVTRTSLVS